MPEDQAMPTPQMQINSKDEVYKINLTQWEKQAITQIINNGNYKGVDIPLVVNLQEKIKNAEEIKDKQEEKTE